MHVIWCQQWEESEAGWGQRPEGYSLHLNKNHAKKYVKKYMDWQRNYFKSEGVKGTPSEYSRPCGEAYEVRVGDKKFEELKKKKRVWGLRFYENIFPKPIKINTRSHWRNIPFDGRGTIPR